MKVLYVSTEVMPYLPESEISSQSFEAAKAVNANSGQTRIFMPRYGLVNERRHQLHEVIRLSGMNLVINDLDMPLIIKVASIPKEKMQVYFIDNEDYFKRKALFTDEESKLFEDNDERAIFFAKGVIETVKKLNWAPDIIHVHGWMASLLPLYLRNYYADEPLFQDSKVVYSVFKSGYEGELSKELFEKIKFDEFNTENFEDLKDSGFPSLMKNAIENSDAIIVGSNDLEDENLSEHISNLDKPVLNYSKKEEFVSSYINFISELIPAEADVTN